MASASLRVYPTLSAGRRASGARPRCREARRPGPRCWPTPRRRHPRHAGTVLVPLGLCRDRCSRARPAGISSRGGPSSTTPTMVADAGCNPGGKRSRSDAAGPASRSPRWSTTPCSNPRPPPPMCSSWPPRTPRPGRLRGVCVPVDGAARWRSAGGRQDRHGRGIPFGQTPDPTIKAAEAAPRRGRRRRRGRHGHRRRRGDRRRHRRRRAPTSPRSARPRPALCSR